MSDENDIMTIVSRMAAEIVASETALRHRIIKLIDIGRIEEAKALLRSWDTVAAGELLSMWSQG